jgi:phosphotransferase family enzyme
MEPSELESPVEAGRSVASGLGLQVDDAVVVHNSDRIAIRLIPCDVLARVAPRGRWHAASQFEAKVARLLAETNSPVGELEPRVEPRVYLRDGFAITLWTYYELASPAYIAPADYAHALIRLHAGLRQIDLAAPHFTDSVADALRELGDGERNPDLGGFDRELLSNMLSRVSTLINGWGTNEQLLHGDSWSGNLLNTRRGPLFVDLHDCCHGPVEYDIASAPEEVAEHYPGANQDLVHQCRILTRALTTTWRWRRDDQFPNRNYWRVEGLNQLRAALDRYGLDVAD